MRGMLNNSYGEATGGGAKATAATPSSTKTKTGLYDKVAGFLCGIGSDKYVHLLACMAVARACRELMPWWTAIAVAAVVGLVKETLDGFRGERIDFKDLLADVIGAAAGGIV